MASSNTTRHCSSDGARSPACPRRSCGATPDSVFPPAFLEHLVEALPHAELTTLAGVGHWPHEEAPDAVIRAIEAVLARADASHPIVADG